MPASIVATATAVPPHLITADDVKKHIQSIFHLEGSRLDGMFSIVENSHIKQRHTIFPLDYTVQPRPLTQTSLEYQEHAIRLGQAGGRGLPGARGDEAGRNRLDYHGFLHRVHDSFARCLLDREHGIPARCAALADYGDGLRGGGFGVGASA